MSEPKIVAQTLKLADLDLNLISCVTLDSLSFLVCEMETFISTSESVL